MTDSEITSTQRRQGFFGVTVAICLVDIVDGMIKGADDLQLFGYECAQIHVASLT